MKPARYMLDANTVSYILGGKSAKARQRLLELKSGEEICISVITEAEVRYGVRKRPVTPETRLAIEAFLEQIDVLSWTSAAAKAYAALRADNEAKGISSRQPRYVNCSTFVAERAILVTSDRSFRRVHDLVTRNWTD